MRAADVVAAFPRSITQAVTTLAANPDARSATKYASEKIVIKATHRSRPRANATHVEIVLTVGTPNFRERAFLRACKKAGEQLPVVRCQLTRWPRKKKAAR